MKHFLVTFCPVLLLTGCQSLDYKFLAEVKESAKVEMPLYEVAVPSVSIFGPWKRYEKVGSPNDLILTEGWVDESYAASVSVKLDSSLRTAEDVKRENIEGVLLKGGQLEELPQGHLTCVRQPTVSGEAKPYPVGSFFIYAMGCLDATTNTFYALAVSWKVIDDRGIQNNPSPDLKKAADEFFSSFRVRTGA